MNTSLPNSATKDRISLREYLNSEFRCRFIFYFISQKAISPRELYKRGAESCLRKFEG